MSVSEMNSSWTISLDEVSFAMMELNVFGLLVAPVTNRPPYLPTSSTAIVIVSAGRGSLST